MGSSNGCSISACLRKTLPRHALHSTLSNTGILSRAMTPATKVNRVCEGPTRPEGGASPSVSGSSNPVPSSNNYNEICTLTLYTYNSMYMNTQKIISGYGK